MNIQYAWEKLKLMILALEIMGIFLVAGFYAGQYYAVSHTHFTVDSGVILMELDGHEYVHILEDLH